jgi:hypothetical protein
MLRLKIKDMGGRGFGLVKSTWNCAVVNGGALEEDPGDSGWWQRKLT